MSEVTQILSQLESGDPTASDRLLPLVYEELRSIARARMAREKPGQTLQATALVHEAFACLVRSEKPIRWESRGHFFGAAAEAMRRILVDQARKKKSLKAGGNLNRVELKDADMQAATPDIEILALHQALERFETIDPRAANVVKLRYFAGLTLQEIADALGISLFTVKTDWSYAKNWLRKALT